MNEKLVGVSRVADAYESENGSAPSDTVLADLGDHLKAAIRYHFKTGHREAA
jgi:hypothetical protein